MKHLLQHFKTLTKHPKNAEELKALILQLAIQGKLTENWRACHPELVSGSNSASKLLERIKAEKKVLIAEKKIKKEKPLPSIEEEEKPYELPINWVWTKLGEISLVVGGGTPKSTNPEFYTDEEIPWFTPADLGKTKSKYVTRGRRDITELGLQKSSAQLMPAGSVLFSSRAPIGHTAIGLVDFSTNQGFKSSVPYVMEMNEFIYHYLNSIVKSVNENASGTTFKEVSGTIVKNFLFPLPPLEEQKAIVAIVNELFTEVEQLEDQTKTSIQLKEDFVTSALQRLSQTENLNQEWQFLQTHFTEFFTEKENVKQLRETILQLAVQGKLTSKWRSQNPNTEPASELLKRIQTEKAALIAQKKIKKEKPLPPIEDHEKPYDLPEGWENTRVAQITTIKGGKRVPKGYKLSDSPTDHIYIRVTDMKNGTVNLDGLKYITNEVYEQIKAYTISKDDLYITIAGTIGDVGEIPEELDGMNLTENAAKIILYQVNKQYLKILLSSKVCQKQFFEKVNQMAQPKLALHRIGSTVIPLPPLEEQKAIVKQVNSLMALCDSLEEHIDNSQTQIEQLMQSCLREVFEENK